MQTQIRVRKQILSIFDPFCVIKLYKLMKPIQFSIATAYGILVAILSLFTRNHVHQIVVQTD